MSALVLILLLIAFFIGHSMGEGGEHSPGASGLVAIFLTVIGMGIYLLGDKIATEDRELQEHLVKVNQPLPPSTQCPVDMGVNRAD